MLSLAGCALLATSAAFGQVEQQMGTFVSPHNHHMRADDDQQLGQDQQQQDQQPSQQQPQPVRTQPQTQPVAYKAAVPPSMLDKPPLPAKIDLTQGQLSIHADNSSLIDIMHRLTADAGMTVDGLNKDQRIFGTYGPGNPQDVISELLDGSGYNVVMLGRTQTGTPKQITLTPRTGGVSGGPGGMRQQAQNQDEPEDEEPPPQPPVNAPPVETPPEPAPPGNGVRTPQQMLQELQQMRQQQMQQQQQQGQPNPQQ